MGWALHGRLFKLLPTISESISLFLPKVGDLDTVIVNLGNWKKFMIKLTLHHFPRGNRLWSHVI